MSADLYETIVISFGGLHEQSFDQIASIEKQRVRNVAHYEGSGRTRGDVGHALRNM
jgi:hypothetical protein